MASSDDRRFFSKKNEKIKINAPANSERASKNKDIKDIEKWVHHSSALPKVNRNGFVVDSGILVQFKPVN